MVGTLTLRVMGRNPGSEVRALVQVLSLPLLVVKTLGEP